MADDDGRNGVLDKENRERGLEENFARLEEIIEELEGDDISLEDAFRAYSAGMGILKTCNEQIDRVEKQVLKLNEEGAAEVFADGEK
jgi:exodeoxyribonuclease VII small subunit